MRCVQTVEFPSSGSGDRLVLFPVWLSYLLVSMDSGSHLYPLAFASSLASWANNVWLVSLHPNISWRINGEWVLGHMGVRFQVVSGPRGVIFLLLFDHPVFHLILQTNSLSLSTSEVYDFFSSSFFFLVMKQSDLWLLMLMISP